MTRTLRAAFAPLMPLGARAIGAASQLGVTVVAAQTAGLADTGKLVALQSFGRFGEYTIAGGLSVAAYQFAARTPQTARTLLTFARRIFYISFFLCALMIVVEVASGPSFALALLVTVTTSSSLRVSTDLLRGASRPVMANLTELLLTSVITVAVISGAQVGVLSIVSAWPIGLLVAAAVALAAISRTPGFRIEPTDGARHRAIIELWWNERSAMWANLGAVAVWTVPFLAFTLLNAPPDEVGAFAVASRALAVATLILTGLADFYSPRFAAAWRSHSEAIPTLFRRSQLWSITLYSPIFVLAVVSPGALLRLWRADSSLGVGMLRVLAVAQLVNAATGLSTAFLLMIDEARREATITWAAAAACGLLAWPAWEIGGALGLTAVYGGSLAARNLASYAVGNEKRVRVCVHS